MACPFLLHGHEMLTLSIWVAEALHARLSYSRQQSYGCLLGSGSLKQWDRSRAVTPPFRISDSARNFPPSISLSSGGVLALSADTGPSAVAAALRHAGKVCYPLRCTLCLLLYITRHMTGVHKEVHHWYVQLLDIMIWLRQEAGLPAV